MTTNTRKKTTNEWSGPTWLTRRYYKALGYHVEHVEKFFEKTQTRKDAFGFADFFCFKASRSGVVAVNACGYGEVNAHLAKFRILVTAWDFLLSNSDNKIVIAEWKPGEQEPYCVHLKLSHFDYERNGDWGICGRYRPKWKTCRECKKLFIPFACDRCRNGQLCLCTRVDYWGRANAIFDRCPQCHFIVPKDLFNN